MGSPLFKCPVETEPWYRRSPKWRPCRKAILGGSNSDERSQGLLRRSPRTHPIFPPYPSLICKSGVATPRRGQGSSFAPRLVFKHDGIQSVEFDAIVRGHNFKPSSHLDDN